jgi:hypothetical protein
MVIGKAIAIKREFDTGSLQLNVPGDFWKSLRSALETSGYRGRLSLCVHRLAEPDYFFRQVHMAE